MTKGKVYFVGAGPGDVGLITVKGQKAIEKSGRHFI
ncbi:SAM-dependent methyltransferase [Peribacillus frigoritolerans]|nr:SAM-dependent methyltransferase [Peribacillus frigoritolerans]